MALIRGLGGLFPCPRCLVPKEKLSKIDVPYELRTAESTRETFLAARNAPTKAQEEAIVKKKSLRMVKVQFPNTANILYLSDVFLEFPPSTLLFGPLCCIIIR
jgi:hypothetical protein